MSARSYSSPTAHNARNFPAGVAPHQRLEEALGYAALAPTEDGWQPWFFQVEGNQIEVATKKNPVRELADPDRREFLIGCGAALLYLKLALKHFGCFGKVALFPDLGRPELVARIQSGLSGETSEQEKTLFKAMRQSRAHQTPLAEMPMTEVTLAALGHAAAGERGWLDFIQSEPSWQQVARIVPADEPRGPHSASRASLSLSFGGRVIRYVNGTVEPTPSPAESAIALAVVKTKTDDKYGWLEAGQTMGRTILQAQALGLSWDFYDPVRRREAREALRVGIGHKGFAQVILQFGGGNLALADAEMEEDDQTALPNARWR